MALYTGPEGLKWLMDSQTHFSIKHWSFWKNSNLDILFDINLSRHLLLSLLPWLTTTRNHQSLTNLIPRLRSYWSCWRSTYFLLASQVTSSHLTKKFHKTQHGKTKLNTKHCIVSVEHLDLVPGGSNFYTLKIHHQHQGGRRKTKNENDAIFPTKFATFLLHFDAI